MTEVVPTASVAVVNEDPLQHVRVDLVDTIDKAFEFKRWLGERREILGIDTETGGFRHDRDPLRLVQFGDMNHGWAIGWDDWAGVVKEALQYEEDIVFHNAPFDVKFLVEHAGWDPPWHRIEDTMTQAHLEDPTRPKALKNLATRHVSPHAAGMQSMLADTMKREGWTWGTVPVSHPHYWAYGAVDPVLTAHVHHKLRPKVTAIGADRAYDLEMACLRVVTNMMLRRARIDLGHCQRKAAELRDWVLACSTWLNAQYGIVNPMSNQQVLSCLQGLGFTFTKLTASRKNYALDKEVLDSIDHEVADQVIKVRRANKIAGTYLENFIQMADDDGWLSYTINSMGAKTGRMSMTNPNLQNLYRDDPTVRNAFIPSEGNVIISCDADQIEMRLAAHFSDDQGLVDAFLSPDDFFCTVASRLFEEEIRKGDRRRQITKNTAYGRLYGAGAPTIARTAKVTPEVAEAFVQRFDHQFPGLGRLMHRLINEGQQHLFDEGIAYISTPLGRRLPVVGDKDYALLNYEIQGHAAEVLKKGLVDLDATGLGPYMLFPVHDEIVTDVPKKDAVEVKHLIEQTLTDQDTYRVPITWSAEIFTERWSTKV